jgi:hypothetical protein
MSFLALHGTAFPIKNRELFFILTKKPFQKRTSEMTRFFKGKIGADWQ